METKLASRIIQYMRLKKYQVFSGANQYNIVYLEGANVDGSPNADLPNCFNDRRLVIEVSNGVPVIKGNWEATTEPGNYYTFQPMNPQGAARIAFGQYNAWQVGLHGRSDPHESLVQVSPVSVCRDLNKDFKRTGDRVCAGNFGINQHWGYDLPQNNVANASAGCLVGRTRSGHSEFMRLIKRDVRYQRDRRFTFTSTVIAGDDLAKVCPM